MKKVCQCREFAGPVCVYARVSVCVCGCVGGCVCVCDVHVLFCGQCNIHCGLHLSLPITLPNYEDLRGVLQLLCNLYLV